MKTKSTYSLLINADAEEKGRSIFETAVYSLVVLCTALSVWHFASGEVTLPGQTSTKEAPVSIIANAPVNATAQG
ncbi:MAG: hypothetical protein ABR589_12480 [Chthoniobacterales bacterium]